MSSVWERYGAVISVTALLGVPIGALVVLWLLRRRINRGWPPSWAWRATVAEVCLVVGTAPWVWMILTPTSGSRGLQLVPLHDVQAVLRGDDSMVQVVGNLLAFTALGFFLPIRFRLAHAVWVPGVVALVLAGLSLFFEVLQFTLQLGRVASVDDILLNTVGAVLAALASVRWWRSRRPDQPSRTSICANAASAETVA
jgi:glycopeptide antibiotics resistance protein